MDDRQERFFLGRQPILDREQRIMGYELLFRVADTPSADIVDYSHAGSSVILGALSSFGFRELLGKHKGFFNVTEQLLMSDALEILPRDRIVLELLETISVSNDLINRCRDLREKGFSLALDDHVFHPRYELLYPLIDIVKIDILQMPLVAVADMVKTLREYQVTLLAEKVEDTGQFRECMELGFHLFQGYYFARPSVLQKKRVDVAGSILLKLLQLVLQDADIREIEETFRQNPGLTFNLLQLVNSVAVGTREEIKTLRHALMVLGLQQLKRWIQLALFTYGTIGAAAPLFETAAFRGRLMELLVQRGIAGNGDADYPDRAFMTGVLSLVDVLLETSMDQIVSQLNLAEDVSIALLERKGELGHLLNLVEMLEAADFQGAADLLGKSGGRIEVLLESQLEAINWANRLEEVG